MLLLIAFGTRVTAEELLQGTSGPGLKPVDPSALRLPAANSAELLHVDAATFAEACDNDPERIFTFVRDHIAYEAYPGSLRGARGTLLALAGNSVDRATLLADMLKHAGYEVRFAHGQLPEKAARELVHSMWQKPSDTPAESPNPSAPLQDAANLLVTNVHRDYALLRSHLGEVTANSQIELQQLISEAQAHTWVQVERDGKWVDWDPTFADSAPGQSYTTAKTTFAKLPEDWLHRLSIRLEVEEYPLLLAGDDFVEPAVREVLRFDVTAAELSGMMVFLSHQPEKWRGPNDSLETALAAAIEETGRIKPVLLLNGKEPQAQLGETFQQALLAGGGLGRVGGLLRGAGTRKPVPIATAEWLTVECISPDGKKQSVRREIFDVVGPARRASDQPLSPEEARTRTADDKNISLTDSVFALYFTSGRVQSLHLATNSGESQTADGINVTSLFARLLTTFTSASDELVSYIPSQEGIVRCYCDTPRLHIANVRKDSNGIQMAIDLRQDHVRAVALADNANTLAHRAQVFRGVVEGTLERVVMERFFDSQDQDSPPMPVMSTSRVFDLAGEQNIPLRLFTTINQLEDADSLPDGRQRLEQDLEQGFLVVAPQRPVDVEGEGRLAWWRIDPATGATTAVIDLGLHGAPATEKPTVQSVFKCIHDKVLNIYYIEFVVGEVGLAGRTFLVIAGTNADFTEDFLHALRTTATTVLYTTIP